MATFSTEELVPTTKLAKNFGSYISKINENKIDKIGVFKNNKLNAVIISPEMYELFEELIEHIDIYNTVKQRENKGNFVDGNEVLKKFNLSIN